MRDYTLYLKDILAAIESIEDFIAGMDLDTFQIDDKTTSAVMRKLEIIGEAVKQIPDEIRQNHSQVPWKEMAGMRDKLIHFYFGVPNTAHQPLSPSSPLAGCCAGLFCNHTRDPVMGQVILSGNGAHHPQRGF